MSTSIKTPDENPSNVESILSDTIGLPGYTINPPGSRIETLLIELNELIKSGGGGGGSDIYAANLSLTIDSNTYVITAVLKNQNGESIGTPQTIDLPLESVVVGGSYNSQTQKVVLTLQNGNTVEFSVADLVSGLQTEITSVNKLDADLVDDVTSTNKFVTSGEKSTWNGKQNALSSAQLDAVNSGIDATKVAQIATNESNISSILDGTTIDSFEDVESALATKADTSTTYTKTEVDTALSGKQNVIDNSHKLSADNVDDTNATNKFATAAELEQIETNKNNILYNTKNGVSNVLPLNTAYVRGVHADVTNPSKIHFYGTPNSSGTLSGLTKRITLKEGTYTIIVNTDFDTSLNTDIYLYDMTTSDTLMTLEESGTYEFTANPAHEYLYAFWFNQGVAVDFNYQVTVRPKNSPDVGFQPYAMSNADLTALSEEDRAALAELVDGGAKNLLEVPTTTVTNNGVQFTISNGVITATILSETRTEAAIFNIADSLNLKKNEEYIFMVGLPSEASSSTYFYDVYDASWANRGVYSITRTLESSRKRVRFVIAKEYTGAVGTTIIAKPMICTKPSWDISQAYQPYRPSYQELYEKVETNKNNISKDEAAIAELVDANRRKVYANTEDGKSYTFSNLYGLNESRFKYALVCGGGTANNPALAMAWFVFIDNSGVVTARKIIGDSPRTLTGSVSGTTLTLTSDSTMYGGLRLIWLS